MAKKKTIKKEKGVKIFYNLKEIEQIMDNFKEINLILKKQCNKKNSKKISPLIDYLNTFLGVFGNILIQEKYLK